MRDNQVNIIKEISKPEIAQKLRIDPSKIVLNGYSKGGIVSFWIARAIADIIHK